MSASTRNRRVEIFAHSATDDGGYATDVYTRENSAATDRKWWASVGTASGREGALGGQAQHTADVVLGFGRGVPISPDDVVRLHDGRLVRVTSPALPRDNGTDEVQVTALYVDDAQAADFPLVET